jgi:hypothetical protein
VIQRGARFMAKVLSGDEIRQQLQITHQLFQSVRKKFDGPNAVRGGYERPLIAPVMIRKFKTDVQDDVKYSVEASYTEEQLNYVNDTLIELKGFIAGRRGGKVLADSIVYQYLHGTAPYFMLAMLKATEDTLTDFIKVKPQHAIVLDAIFRVAGGEGIRDLIRIYGTRLLENAIHNTDASLPGIFAFIDTHDCYRKDAAGRSIEVKYEVWCPGRSLAKIYFDQCKIAADKLVKDHNVQYSPSSREEFQAFPSEISVYMREFMQQLLAPVLEKYQVDL